MFGGHTDNIYIYDVDKNNFRGSKVKCPISGRFHAVIDNDLHKEKLIVFGFINDCYKKEEFID